ncbi:hypothetical protein FLAVO9AF_110049 [Flavobacterium sp. 9AF]|nr:hypothetical protein FLAVO9AF_110049 [Flavobacterium sp. 9AF]
MAASNKGKRCVFPSLAASCSFLTSIKYASGFSTAVVPSITYCFLIYLLNIFEALERSVSTPKELKISICVLTLSLLTRISFVAFAKNANNEPTTTTNIIENIIVYEFESVRFADII